MWPLLRPGDVARIEPLDRPARPGDIVVYVDRAARLVAHRVIETFPDGKLHLRGDFAFTADPPVEPRRLVGRLTSVERAGRSIRLEGPIGRLLAMALPPLERAAPGLLLGLRRSAVQAVQLGDRLWTAAPVRRLRRTRSPAVRVALARPQDRDVLLAHIRRCGRDPAEFDPALAASGRVLVVVAWAERPAGIVGFARAEASRSPASGVAWRIRDMHVRRRWRGLGVGRAIAAALVRAVHEAQNEAQNEAQHEAPAKLSVAAVTRPSLALFRSLGFEPERGCEANQADLLLPLPLPPTQLAHIVAALCRTPSRA